jgi:hypothetical protein
MSDPVRTLFIDKRFESYDRYVPDEWSAGFFKNVRENSVLDQLLTDFALAWRTTDYVASMPGTFVKALQASLLEYATYMSPDSSLIAFGEKVIAEVSAEVPELIENSALRGRILAALVTSADAFRSRRKKATTEVNMPIQQLWDDFLKLEGFYMTVSATQRVAYVAFYNAYEAFVVDCVRRVLNVAKLRSNDAQFKNGLKTAFGSDLYGPCWDTREIAIGREVRHALSHAGGRETDKVKNLKPGITLQQGILQIVPDDNKKLTAGLRKAVDALVAAAAPLRQFA